MDFLPVAICGTVYGCSSIAMHSCSMNGRRHWQARQRLESAPAVGRNMVCLHAGPRIYIYGEAWDFGKLAQITFCFSANAPAAHRALVAAVAYYAYCEASSTSPVSGHACSHAGLGSI